MQHVNIIKELIQRRYELDQEIAQIQLNRIISVKCGRVAEIDDCTATIRELSYARKEVDRQIGYVAFRLQLPSQFCTVGGDGKVHTILIDAEECAVAVFRTVSTLESLVDASGQVVRQS